MASCWKRAGSVYAMAGDLIRDGRLEVFCSAWCSSSMSSMIDGPRTMEKPGPRSLAAHDFAEKQLKDGVDRAASRPRFTNAA
jgi:hypothetical protein